MCRVGTCNAPSLYRRVLFSGRGGVGRGEDELHLPGCSSAPFCLLAPKPHLHDAAVPDQMSESMFGFIAQKDKMSLEGILKSISLNSVILRL